MYFSMLSLHVHEMQELHSKDLPRRTLLGGAITNSTLLTTPLMTPPIDPTPHDPPIYFTPHDLSH